MLFEIAMLIIGAVTPLLSVYIGGKVLLKKQINDIEERIFDYLESQEGLTMLATLGAAFGNGLMTQFKLGSLGGKTHVKIGPFKIPQAVIDAVVMKYAAPFIGTQKPSTGGLEFGKT